MRVGDGGIVGEKGWVKIFFERGECGVDGKEGGMLMGNKRGGGLKGMGFLFKKV